jgi:protein TonB
MLLAACGHPDNATVQLPGKAAPASRTIDPPVARNGDSPVEYPLALYTQGIDGKVLLRLHVDSTGKVDPDSTKVAESSGYPALDSAALAAVPRLRFAPATRNGVPVALTFTQPILFKHPAHAGGVTP